LDIINTAAEAGFDVVFRWVPREQLVDADALSKFNDRHNLSLTEEAMSIVRARLEEAGLGLWDVDRFAAAHKNKSPRFNSLFATEGAEAVDAFAQSWTDGVSFALHNFNQIGRVLDHVERDDAEAVIIVPEWTRRPFWRRIESGAWRRRVALEFCLEPGSITANRANAEHCFFGDGPFNSRLRVMRSKMVGSAVAREAGSPPFADDPSVPDGDAPESGQGGAKRKRNRAPQPSRSQRRYRVLKEKDAAQAPSTASP
jgi:hypothetical protein